MKAINILWDILGIVMPASNAKSYLEIGCREGDSLMAAISNMTELDLVVVSDTWGGAYGGSGRGSCSHIKKLVESRHNLSIKKLVFLDGDSKETIPEFSKSKQLIDVINIDGDHSYAGCMADMVNCWKILKPGGFIIVDDIYHHAHLYLLGCVRDFVARTPGSVILRELNHKKHGVSVLRKMT